MSESGVNVHCVSGENTAWVSRRLALGGIAALMLPDLARAADLGPRSAGATAVHPICPQSVVSMDLSPLGAVMLPCDRPEWKVARSLLNGAPHTTPFAVATYLSRIEPASYRSQWIHQTYANPLIVDLFTDVNQTPSGDVTPWCAVLMNWCLQRCNIDGTGSPKALSFKGKYKTVWMNGQSFPGNIRQTDIAVFQQKSNPSLGHVGFVLNFNRDFTMLKTRGGNQSVPVDGKEVPRIQDKYVDIKDKFKLLEVRRL